MGLFLGMLAAMSAFSTPFAAAIELNVSNAASVNTAARTLAFGVQSWYTANQSGTPPEAIGTLPQPHYWWQAGAMWGAMVDYWAYTNDNTYNSVTTQGLLAQVGPEWNYMPPAYFYSLGNDDQAFWALAALSAQEYDFPFPQGQRVTSWVDLAKAVFDTQAARWNTQACGGGLKWQIFESNQGYNYRNSISNGAFLQIAARLARYTGNQTYVDWAAKTWDWMYDIGLISPNYQVFDGSDDTINCTELDHTQWSYNPAILLYGTAILANYTNDQVWKERTEGLLTSIINVFFSPYSNATDVMFEAACEPYGTCNYDQTSFKGYLSRWLTKSAVVYPPIVDSIRKRIEASSIAAAASCTGNGSQACGTKWYTGGYDGITGVGQEMSALETVQGLLLLNSPVVPQTGPNVTIRSPPVTSTFPLDPPTATAVPGSDASPSAAGPRTSIGGRSASTERGDGGMRVLVVMATPIVLAVMVGEFGVLG